MTGALQANLNSLGLFAVEAALKGARAIGSLLQSQKNIAGSLQATIELARIMSSWSADPFSDDAEQYQQQIEKYKKPALKFCRIARDTAMIANNAFADINHMAEDSAHSVQQKIQVLETQIRSYETQMYNDCRGIDVSFPLQLFGSRRQIMDWVQARAQEIMSKYQIQIDTTEGTIHQLKTSLNTLVMCGGQTLSWVEMCQTISRNLASTQSTLDAMGNELKIDAVLYRELMESQWCDLLENASEILSIVGLPTDMGGLQVPTGFSINLPISGILSGLMSIDVKPSAKEQLTAAIAPDLHLAKDLTKCTASSASFYSAVRQLGGLPFAADINSGTSSKNPKALLDIVADIRRQYARLAVTHFEAVSSIRTYACTQRYTLQRLKSSTRRDVLIKQMVIQTTQAMQAALRTSEAWSAALASFEKICLTVQTKVTAYTALMKDLDTTVAKGQKELDDYIAGITADAIAVCTVSLTVGAAIFAGPGMAWKIVSQLPTLYKAQGLGWKDTFKTYYKTLDISEKAACIARLQAFKLDMNTASMKLTGAKDAFVAATTGVQDTQLAIGRMYARLMSISERIQTVSSIALDPADIEELIFLWEDVANAAEGWIDEFSMQGISPILHQADDDLMPLADEEQTLPIVNGSY